MIVVCGKDYDGMSRLAADLVAGRIREKPDLALGLATGRTPQGLYAELARRHAEEGLDFSRVTTFNLDEYAGFGRDHAWSCRRFMDEHLFGRVNLDPARVNFPDGLAADPGEECRRYDEALRAAGGVDLQVLGIGRNGHLGFNEPGTPLGSGSHVATLARSTRLVNFGRAPGAPRHGLTMGIASILHARQIVLLASGLDKAAVVALTVYGIVSPRVPASALQLHPRATLVLDEAAASALARAARHAGRSPITG